MFWFLFLHWCIFCLLTSQCLEPFSWTNVVKLRIMTGSYRNRESNNIKKAFNNSSGKTGRGQGGLGPPPLLPKNLFWKFAIICMEGPELGPCPREQQLFVTHFHTDWKLTLLEFRQVVILTAYEICGDNLGSRK